jgi:hypothetical protein
MKLFVPHTLWYEDREGNFLGAPDFNLEPGDRPQGAHYR